LRGLLPAHSISFEPAVPNKMPPGAGIPFQFGRSATITAHPWRLPFCIPPTGGTVFWKLCQPPCESPFLPPAPRPPFFFPPPRPDYGFLCLRIFWMRPPVFITLRTFFWPCFPWGTNNRFSTQKGPSFLFRHSSRHQFFLPPFCPRTADPILEEDVLCYLTVSNPRFEELRQRTISASDFLRMFLPFFTCLLWRRA